MTTTVVSPPLVLKPGPLRLDEEAFYAFCRANPDLRIERTAEGEIVIMAPAGGESGSRNSEINFALRAFAKADGRGVAFDSSTGFVLPNGAVRAPDAAWVDRERLRRLSPEEKQRFLPLCPDFVIELRSPSDRVEDLRAKMDEYIANGARLGWLIDPLTRTVTVYRPGAAPLVLSDPIAVAAEPVLPGFTLNLADIWDPGF
jgi:Uma2 family endonuclease